MAPESIQIAWELDYSDHLYAQATAAMREDREALIAYGTIIKEAEPDNAGVIKYVVEYADSDGWDARGQVEETQTQLGHHATYKRIV